MMLFDRRDKNSKKIDTNCLFLIVNVYKDNSTHVHRIIDIIVA